MLQAQSAAYDVAASAVIRTGVSRVCRVIVLEAGSAAGAVHDCAATADAADSNKVFVIPNTVGIYELDWPTQIGITIVVGTDQVVSVSYR